MSSEGRRWGRKDQTMMMFSEQRADRVLSFILSSCILIVIGPLAIGFTSIYPVDTLLLRVLKAVTGAALILVVQFAGLAWIWSISKAEWTRRWFNGLKKRLVLIMVGLPILVAMWFLTGMK